MPKSKYNLAFLLNDCKAGQGPLPSTGDLSFSEQRALKDPETQLINSLPKKFRSPLP